MSEVWHRIGQLGRLGILNVCQMYREANFQKLMEVKFHCMNIVSQPKEVGGYTN